MSNVVIAEPTENLKEIIPVNEDWTEEEAAELAKLKDPDAKSQRKEHWETTPLFEQEIAALFIRDVEFLRLYCDLFKDEYFRLDSHQLLYDITLKHFKKYGVLPQVGEMQRAIKKRHPDKED